MKDLLYQYLQQRLSRRGFMRALGALGFSAAAVDAMVRAAAAVDSGDSSSGYKASGTGGELLVEQMHAASVRFLFTNTGSSAAGLLDAFLARRDMQLILGLHEGIVVAMADGYHKISREPAFVNVHAIAGTAQSAGQLYNLSRDRSSIVFTAGLIESEAYDDVVLAPRPGFDQKDVNQQFTKISWEARVPGVLPLLLRRAFKVALTEPGGPVYLGFTRQALQGGEASADIFPRERFIIPSAIPPNPDQVNVAAGWLLEARAPLLCLGDEVWRAGAQAECLELAELLGIPVIEGGISSFRSFPRRHPLFRGGASTADRDLLIDVGGAAVVGRSGGREGTEARIVQIGLDTSAWARVRPFDLAMVAHPGLALRAITETIKEQATAQRLARIRQSRETARDVSPSAPRKRMGIDPVHPNVLGWVLEEELDRDAILVVENVTGADWYFSTGFREGEKTWVSSSGGGLGWGVGASAGAKLAAPDRQVVCSIGDGAVMYAAAGFWTQARYEIPVLTVVSNNRNYQSVRRLFDRHGGRMKDQQRYPGVYLGDPDIDFVRLAASQGVAGLRVEHAADLRFALRRGLAATREGRPFLIDVNVRRTGDGAASDWYQRFSLAESRTRKV